MRTYADSLWIDPQGKIYECKDHYYWIVENWTKHFDLNPPTQECERVHTEPSNKGWARVKNLDDELGVGVDPQRITRSQKIVIRKILDEDHKRTLYIDAWIHDGDRKPKDKILVNYDEIVDYLS